MFFKSLQDHNIDFIVNFPDWDPSLKHGSDMSKDHIQNILTQHGRRNILLQGMSSDLPKSHIWYSTHEVVNALRLFLDAGNELSKSSTYR